MTTRIGMPNRASTLWIQCSKARHASCALAKRRTYRRLPSAKNISTANCSPKLRLPSQGGSRTCVRLLGSGAGETSARRGSSRLGALCPSASVALHERHSLCSLVARQPASRDRRRASTVVCSQRLSSEARACRRGTDLRDRRAGMVRLAPVARLRAALELHRLDVRPGDDEVAFDEPHGECGHP